MLNRDVFSKYKPNVNLTTRFDSDGKEIQVEIREDTEQIEKLQEIIDILVAAGYFRARIKGLSSFDKVIGGMTWCIESCNFDVDVDLLFHENLTIGQKIALTEKIVSVLLQMQCPHNIEPHQIQGLDFISIFPVTQWLVKKSVESREEKAESHRAFAIGQFDKTFSIQSDIENRNRICLLQQKLKQLLDEPKRKYRLKGPRPEDELSRVQITLLEYGMRNSIHLKSQKSKSSDEEGKNYEENLEEKQEINVEELDDKAILDKLISCEDDSENLENLENLDPREISEHYTRLRAELDSDAGKNYAKKKLENLKTALLAHSERLLKEKIELEKKIEENRKLLAEKQEARKNKEVEITNLMTQELDDNKKRALQQIQELVSKIEGLRKQESKFKESCKVEIADFEKRISQLELGASTKPEEEASRLQDEVTKETERIQALRLKLAKRTRAVVTIQRKLDQIPGRAELAQYQRRFLELYNQVSAKHRETKQFFTLYNTLDDTKLYLSKELSLLNSIFDNYAQAMQSTQAREQFIRQFENIVEGIKITKKKVEARYNEEKSKRDSLNEQLLLLIDQQRKYFMELRNLTKECEKNEKLLAKFKSLQ